MGIEPDDGLWYYRDVKHNAVVSQSSMSVASLRGTRSRHTADPWPEPIRWVVGSCLTGGSQRMQDGARCGSQDPILHGCLFAKGVKR